MNDESSVLGRMYAYRLMSERDPQRRANLLTAMTLECTIQPTDVDAGNVYFRTLTHVLGMLDQLVNEHPDREELLASMRLVYDDNDGGS